MCPRFVGKIKFTPNNSCKTTTAGAGNAFGLAM